MRHPLRLRFVREVAVGGTSQSVNAFLAMISGIWVARYLGPSSRGTLSVLIALGSTSVLLGSLGVHFSAVYFQGRLPSRRDAILSNTILVATLGGLTTTTVLVIVGFLFRTQ